MSTAMTYGLALLLVCVGAVMSSYLDEEALRDLAELEGYQMTLHELHRVRRQVTDTECRCPNDNMPPPPPPDMSGEEGRPPPPPPGCPRFPPPHMHHRMRVGEGKVPPCELRPLFRVPEKFNFSARASCFDQWERPTATQYGLTPETRRDFGKFKPWQRHALLWNKGCDMQCLFSEMELLSGVTAEEVTVEAGAVTKSLGEEGDSSDITMAIESAIKTCLDSNEEMVHVKQVCRSGADEFLFCLQRTLEESCPGAKWQGQRSCDEVADASSMLRSCFRRRRMMHPHPPHPPPPFGDRWPRPPQPSTTLPDQDLSQEFTPRN